MLIATSTLVSESVFESLASGVSTEGTQFQHISTLSEASFDDKNRTMQLNVISEGWSKNGFYYTPKSLQSMAAAINTSANRVFLNHNSRTELFAPRKMEDLVAVSESAWVDGRNLKSKTKFFESGPNAWVFDRLKEAPSISGPSIVGKALIRKGVAEGREGNIVEDVAYFHAFEIVAQPSAGGKADIAEAFDTTFVVEAAPEAKEPSVPSISEVVKKRKEREEARSRFWAVEYVMTDLAMDILQCRGEFCHTPVEDRKKMATKVIEDFKAEVLKIKFPEPDEMPEMEEQVQESETEDEFQVTSSIPEPPEAVTRRLADGVSAKVSTTAEGSVVHRISFSKKLWTKERVQEFCSSMSKKRKTKPVKEGIEEGDSDMDPKTIAELKAKFPTLCEALLAEAQTDAAQKQVADELKVVKNDLSEALTKVTDLSTKVTSLTEENTALKTQVSEAENAKKAGKAATLLAEAKAEVQLAEEAYTDTFNKILSAVVYEGDDAKYKTAVLDLLKDRAAVTKTVTKPIVEGVNLPKPKPATTTVAEGEFPLKSEDLAKKFKS